MKCPRCHSENPDTSRYCGNCAALLAQEGQPPVSLTKTLEEPVEVVAMGSIIAGKYRIEGRIGQGGMGVVYRAEDIKLKRPVALKFLPPHLVDSAELRERFLVEARAAAALSHPNICVIHEVGEASGQPFIAMEYVEGETLRERIKKGPLEANQALDVAIQVAAGLGEAHRKGVIHRDIKSANIMVTPEGQAKIMDFGLAKRQGGSVLTKSQTTMGTVPYMSPEQALGEHVDHRTDIWSLGVVLYELLAGELPFKGDTDLSVIHSIVHEDPRPLKALETPVPDELKRVVAHALGKKPDARYGAADEMMEELKAYRSSLELARAGALNVRALWHRLRRPRVAVPVVAALLALAAFGVWYSRHQARVRWAREVALPEIERIVSQNWRDFGEGYALAERAEQVIPHDPRLAELFSRCSLRVNVRTEPLGARVYVKAYTSPEAEWRYLGVSPIEKVRLPFGVFRWKLEKEGYETVLAAACSQDVQIGAHIGFVPGDLLRVLDRKESIPAGMVRVTGATTAAGQLDDFFIDRYEVTNSQYREFVNSGGYTNRKYWKHGFVVEGKELPWEEAVKRLVDQTGRPGPATWQAGDCPEGQGEYPVSGISWYEAAAYAEFAGKSLPTKDHWGLARGKDTALIRWPQLGGDALFAPFSNFFKGRGSVAVGTMPGMTSYGAFDMAGNVREWCWNQTPKGRLIRGGAWDDNTYMFGALSQAPPMDRSPKNGFRCALYPGPGKIPALALETVTFEAPRDWYKQSPVSDEVFRVYKEQFSYDKADLNARVEARRETPEWTQERITFDAAYGGERIITWLFVPKNARPPYQTVIYFPGSASEWEKSSERIEDYYEFQGFLSFIVKNGRAVLYPVYKGTFERGSDSLAALLDGDWSSHQYTDVFVQEVKDFRRCVDYLETRPDIDAGRLAYYGMSWGGILGAIIPAVEGRIKASVLVAGGFMGNPRPEADPVNYATRVNVPTLMLNGRYDTLLIPETSQEPMFDLLGTLDKQRVLDETDHIPTTVVYIRETLAWLDRYLGPVTR
jgi:cephalosporin-C deacetylase-like acetyl esterase/predicted Ser/Thr protein kinase